MNTLTPAAPNAAVAALPLLHQVPVLSRSICHLLLLLPGAADKGQQIWPASMGAGKGQKDIFPVQAANILNWSMLLGLSINLGYQHY